MDKREFLKQYRQQPKKIFLAAFNDDLFLCRNDIQIIEREVKVDELENYYCPWYYLDTIIKSFEDALCDIRVRGIHVSDSDKIDLDSQRKKIIEEYQKKDFKNLEKVPVATHLGTNRTLF